MPADIAVKSNRRSPATHRADALLSAVSALGLGLLFCASSAAQTIYKYTDAAGNSVFTDQPNPALRVLSRFQPPPGPPYGAPAQSQSMIATDTSTDVKSALALGARLSSRQSLSTDMKEATRRLQEAKSGKQHGSIAQLGEQGSGASAGVFNEHYWVRQAMLQRRLDEADRRYEALKLLR